MTPPADDFSDAPPGEPLVEPIQQRRLRKYRALAEVLICSDFPTQLAIAGVLGQLGIHPMGPDKRLSAQFVYLISVIDTVVLLTLIVVLLRAGGERPRDVFLGRGRTVKELAVGLALVPAAFALVMLLQIGIHVVVPFLRNVPENPFQSLMGSPLRVAAFVGLVLVAGGIREELQRAFLLHRFEQHLGGAKVGLLVTSLAFGLGHALQGWDAVVVTGLLGGFWGVIYVWRRNVLPGIISHALFNVGEVLLAFTALSPPN